MDFGLGEKLRFMFRLDMAEALIQDNCWSKSQCRSGSGSGTSGPWPEAKMSLSRRPCRLIPTYTRGRPTLNIPLQIIKQRNVHSAVHFAPGLRGWCPRIVETP